MFQLSNNQSLKEKNTFGITATARYYLIVKSESELYEFFKNNRSAIQLKRLFLGAGSNLLFLDDFNGLVIHPLIGGINLVRENKYQVEVEVGAGISWDNFVAFCVDKGWHGIENLSLIPGNTGAVPVQNIGAYGVEAGSVISEVRGIDIPSLKDYQYNHKACEFNYRTSLFKEKLKEQFVITSVVFRLSKQPNFKIQYEGLEEKINQYGKTNLQNIRKAIIAIRQSKLPDPAVFGNAGSFFKNPVVSELVANSLKNLYPELPVYSIGHGVVKLAAGWLIDKAGWKGKSVGNAAVHEKQALVLINKGGASGKEIFRLSELIADDVLQKFNIHLEREVQVIGD